MTASNLFIKTAAAVAIVAGFGVAQAQTTGTQGTTGSPGVNQNRVQPELNSNRGAIANTPGTTGGSTNMGSTGSSNMGTTGSSNMGSTGSMGSSGSMGTTGSGSMGTSGSTGTSDSMRMGSERNMRSDRN